jgi:hypothetical protein
VFANIQALAKSLGKLVAFFEKARGKERWTYERLEGHIYPVGDTFKFPDLQI